MLRFFFIMFLVYGVYACDSEDPTSGENDSLGDGIWAESVAFSGDERVLAVSFQEGDDVYVGLGYNQMDTTDKYPNNFYKFDGTTWTSVADSFPDKGREGCVAFVIGDTAYVGAGYRKVQRANIVETYYSDFYKFNLETEKWIKGADGEYLTTDIADYVAADLISCKFWSGIGFELKGKGYVGTGYVDGAISSSIFCYDPQTGTWTSSTISGDLRAGAVVFKLGEKVVVCLGIKGGNSNVLGVVTFDGTTWEKKSPLVDLDGNWNDDYGKIPRSGAVAFTSDLDGGLCGYIAGGSSNTVWRYNLEKDRWYEVEEFSSSMSIRLGGIGFSINGVGYITTGGSSNHIANNNTTWKFTPGIENDN